MDADGFLDAVAWRRRHAGTSQSESSRVRCCQCFATSGTQAIAPRHTPSVQDKAIAQTQFVGIQYGLVYVHDVFAASNAPTFVTNDARTMFARRIGAISIAVIPGCFSCRHVSLPCSPRLTHVLFARQRSCSQATPKRKLAHRTGGVGALRLSCNGYVFSSGASDIVQGSYHGP